MTLRIRSLRTTAGLLSQAPLSFAPQLTTIIGARGTCKSTIIETIRFVFDRAQTLHEARRIAYRHASQGQPVELVMRDAYHRVAHRELVNA